MLYMPWIGLISKEACVSLIGVQSTTKSRICSSCTKNIVVGPNGKLGYCEHCKLTQKLSANFTQWSVRLHPQEKEKRRGQTNPATICLQSNCATTGCALRQTSMPEVMFGGGTQWCTTSVRWDHNLLRFSAKENHWRKITCFRLEDSFWHKEFLLRGNSASMTVPIDFTIITHIYWFSY